MFEFIQLLVKETVTNGNYAGVYDSAWISTYSGILVSSVVLSDIGSFVWHIYN